MPVGCWLNHIIIKKSSLHIALEHAQTSGQLDSQHFLRALLEQPHQDDYLVALEDMGGDEFFCASLLRSGLVHDDGADCVDFYTPYSGCPRATWLEEASIKNIPRTPEEKVLSRWTAYRFVGDPSKEVVLEENDGFDNYVPESFPAVGIRVDPTASIE